jgi:GMP synthase (glutamine-hydrolysing)
MPNVYIFQHAGDVPQGSLSEVFDRLSLPTKVFRTFETMPEQMPLADAAGLVFLGGPMCANDTAEHPFLAVELGWMQSAVARGVPLLGICLGAQMLAKAMGGRVYQHAVREIGFSEIDLLPAANDDRLFAGRKAREVVFQWHGDTFDLPPDAVPLAQGRICRNQAFRIGTKAYGVQFHAEMTPEILDAWLRDKPEKITDRLSAPTDPAAIKAASVVRFPPMNDFSQAILTRLAGLCAGKLL